MIELNSKMQDNKYEYDFLGCENYKKSRAFSTFYWQFLIAVNKIMKGSNLCVSFFIMSSIRDEVRVTTETDACVFLIVTESGVTMTLLRREVICDNSTDQRPAGLLAY